MSRKESIMADANTVRRVYVYEIDKNGKRRRFNTAEYRGINADVNAQRYIDALQDTHTVVEKRSDGDWDVVVDLDD